MSSDAASAAEEHAPLSENPTSLEGNSQTTNVIIEAAQERPPQQKENAEEALESHEVIELQAFIERKEWIEEKIRLLESLPPIDAFAGVEGLSDTQDNPGLATRAQLDEWMAEHDRIEKETEIFDSGDLKKLKKLTKAATQRNLSPQDTDLIELTLTTLYDLEKLLHLLHDRLEHLELLSLRLAWEEHRSSAFKCQEEILSDLRKFLDERARWTPDIYQSGIPNNNSNASVSSSSEMVHSDSSDLMSRSIRFMFAEGLSRDAAQFSSRVTALRHDHVATSGKILDKLIDNSRKPVPDPMLDEQDRLEEKCANEFESIGKFTMLVVMQWKKADEIFVETKKDKASIRVLSEDISRAMTKPPVRRLESNFSGRLDIIRERLQTRTDPASLASTFPLPAHQLFPEQSSSNADIVNSLSSELKSARHMINEVGELVKEYRARCETIGEAESVRKDISEISKSLSQITDRLENGFVAYDGDGSPPDLNTPSCLDPLRFSAYLAMLPTVVEQIATTRQTVTETVRRAHLSVLRLEKTQADDAVKRALLTEIEALQKNAGITDQLKDAISLKVSTLREIRRIWSAMDEVSKSLDTIAEELKESLLLNRWKQETGGDSGPLTPESSQAALPIINTEPAEVDKRLVGLGEQMKSDVNDPLFHIQRSLPIALRETVSGRQRKTQMLLQDLQRMNSLLSAIRKQTSSMEGIREEVHALESRIEEIKMAYDQYLQDVVSFSGADVPSQSPSFTDKEISSKEVSLDQLVLSLRRDVGVLIDSLPTRIPFISRRSIDIAIKQSDGSGAASVKPNVIDAKNMETTALLPFDPAAIDRVVRNDSNAYSLLLLGALKSLLYKQSMLSFFKTARTVSIQLAELGKDIHNMDDLMNEAGESFLVMRSSRDNGTLLSNYLDSIASMQTILENTATHDGRNVSQAVSAIRGLIDGMRDTPGLQDDVNHFGVYTSRCSKLDELDLRWHRALARLDTLRGEVNNAHQNELSRLQREKEALEAQQLVDQLRKEQEEAERLRREWEEVDRRKKEQEDERLKRVEEDAARVREEERVALANKDTSGRSLEDDVFTDRYPTESNMNEDRKALLDRVCTLRKRLNSIGLESVAYPPESSRRMPLVASLPSTNDAELIVGRFESIRREADDLPRSVGQLIIETELRSLREDIRLSQRLTDRIQRLSQLSQHVILCDSAFSGFLDYIDSYPGLPDTEGRPKHSVLDISPEEHLQERMSNAKGIFGDMNEHFRPVADDSRAISEHNRLRQTWEELMEMGLEKLNGRPSRPTSVAQSSGRNSSASASSSHAPNNKRKAFSKLSVGSGKGGFLAPSAQRRAISSSSTSTKAREDAPARSSLTISRSHTPRSVSGPMSPPTTHSFSLYSSTFASRQRTTSLSSTTSSVMSGGRARAVPSVAGRRMSSVQADATRNRSPSVSTSRGTWPRAPRQSFGSVSRATTPDRSTRRKQKYVANPKNKLDVAVGDVVNNLPVDINVEVVADTWKDKSGKYWIGGSEPKLCFCRILRSQTVMVRVGGGWSELSKFIKDHFADLFRLIPESPPRTTPKAEKWISASTLRSADEHEPMNDPQTPESTIKHLPSFALSTPNSSLSQAFPSTPTIGTSLTPLQFMRRAERDPSELSLSSLALSTATAMSAGLSTPSKSHHTHTRVSVPGTPSRPAVWRP